MATHLSTRALGAGGSRARHATRGRDSRGLRRSGLHIQTRIVERGYSTARIRGIADASGLVARRCAAPRRRPPTYGDASLCARRGAGTLEHSNLRSWQPPRLDSAKPNPSLYARSSRNGRTVSLHGDSPLLERPRASPPQGARRSTYVASNRRLLTRWPAHQPSPPGPPGRAELPCSPARPKTAAMVARKEADEILPADGRDDGAISMANGRGTPAVWMKLFIYLLMYKR